jgi:hypothetical protein
VGKGDVGKGDISIAALDVLVNCRRPIAIVTVAERLRLTPQSVSQTVGAITDALDFLGDVLEPGRLGELTSDLATVGLVDRPRHPGSR